MIRKEKVKNRNAIKVTFVLPGDNPHGRASVVGDFNGWDAGALPMARRANGTFSASIVLEAGGRYAFRYLGADGVWCDEEMSDGHEPNPYGGENCVLLT